MADALVRALNAIGYVPVFLPRTQVAPPELYTYTRSSGRLVRHGSLQEYIPAVKDLVPTEGRLGDINAKFSSKKDLDAAVSFLENALKAIGIDSVPKLDLGFAGSNDFSFAFTDVTFRSVDPARLHKLIGTISTEGIPKAYVEDGNLHIAYEYAYAKELVMSRGDRKAFKADISGKVDAYIDLGAKGSVSLENATTISFKSSADAAAFAYKAGRLMQEDGGWVFYPEEVRKFGATEQRQAYVPQRGVVMTAQDNTGPLRAP
jgi:hypothetical protein